MTRSLMLAYALLLAVWAGTTGEVWTVIVVLPHLAAWAWLRGTSRRVRPCSP